MGIKVIIAPTDEPVSILDCRRHLRLEGAYDTPAAHPDDDLIIAMLGAAREHAQEFTGLSLAPQTLELAIDEFGTGEIELPRGPVQSIVSVTYVDEDGADVVIDPENYALDDYAGPRAWLLPVIAYTWPTTQATINAVKVQYIAGFSTPGYTPQTHPLPKSIRAALLLILGHLYENRETTITGVSMQQIPLGAQDLLHWHRVTLGV